LPYIQAIDREIENERVRERENNLKSTFKVMKP